jgi:hypothetical protein
MQDIQQKGKVYMGMGSEGENVSSPSVILKAYTRWASIQSERLCSLLSTSKREEWP